MGLLYQFPINNDEKDYYRKDDQKITIKSYGLPVIFWLYFAGTMMVFFFLTLGVMDPLKKLLSYPDAINQVLGLSMIAILILIPLTMLSFFFYEKRLVKSQSKLTIQYRFFGFTVRKVTIDLNEAKVELGHFLDSPNMARIQNNPQARGFQNKGYFEFYLMAADQKFLIDRSSRKIDLEHLKKLLEL